MTNYKVNIELNEIGEWIAGVKTRTINIQSEQDNLDILTPEVMKGVIDQSSMGPYVKAIRSIKRHFVFKNGALFVVIFPDGTRHLARCISVYLGSMEIIDCGMIVDFNQDGICVGISCMSPCYDTLKLSIDDIDDYSEFRLSMPTEEEMKEFEHRTQNIVDESDASELIDDIISWVSIECDKIDVEKIQSKVYSMEHSQIENHLKKFREVQSLVHDIMKEEGNK